MSKAVGKQVLCAQMRMEQEQAYTYAAEVVAATSQTAGARQGMACFLEKCPPKWPMVEFPGAKSVAPKLLAA